MSKIKVNSIEAATGSTITIPSGQTLDISSTTLTLPSTVVTTTGTQTLTNKTIGVSQLTGTLGVSNGGTGLTSLGTASQVLRVNSGATALEFGTVSSDFVKLYTVTQSSFVSSTIIDGYFDDTIYASYELHIYNLRSSNSSGNHLELRWYSGGSAQTNAAYRWLLNEQYATGTGGGTGVNVRGAYNETSWSQLDGTWGTSADTSDFQRNLIFQILNPQDTSNAKQLLHQYSVISSDGSRAGGTGFCTYASLSSMSGLQIYNNANHKARWTLYGKKK